jgi:hypothetical protein
MIRELITKTANTEMQKKTPENKLDHLDDI